MVIGFVVFMGNLYVFVIISRTRSLRSKIELQFIIVGHYILVGVILEPMHIPQSEEF